MGTREQIGVAIKAARTASGRTQRMVGEDAGFPSWWVAHAELGYDMRLERLNTVRAAVGLPPVRREDIAAVAADAQVPETESSTPVPFDPAWFQPVGGRYWRFPDKRKEDPSIDPVQGEFFTPEGFVDALIRETVQNSLDAVDGENQVRIRIGLYEKGHALGPEIYGRYLAGLWPHLTAVHDGVPAQGATLDFLVIEDFGTVGLTGDVHQHVDKEEGEKNNFYYFWRNIGRSSKSESERGRWGLGKTVFPASSKVNSFFGLTVRRGENRRLLMGQSVLRIHDIDGKGYTPYGAFGEFDNGFALPIADEEFVRQFAADFRLKRNLEPGFSAVIPFFRGDEIDLQELVSSMTEHYFYPILTGDLIVEMSDGDNEVILSSSSLDEVIERFADPKSGAQGTAQKKKMFDLARWAAGKPDPIDLPSPASNAPQWEAVEVADGLRSELQRRFEDGERLRLRMTVPVRLQQNPVPQATMFDIYMERDTLADRRQRHYIRRGITIPNLQSMRSTGARGLVIIEDQLLSSLLGDAENPAHTEWNERSQRAKQKYKYATGTIRFVKSAFDSAVSLLSRPPEGMEEEILSDIFSVQLAKEQAPDRVRDSSPKRQAGPSAPPEISIEPRLPRFAISKAKAGFTVAATGKRTCTGTRLSVRVAYELDGADPWKRYEKFDFELNKPPIWTSLVGVTPGGVDGNEAEFLIEDEEFSITYGGFDPNRDLAVRVDILAEEGE